MFYPFFEISCGEVEYLSQILYKWHTFAGQNADDLPHWARKQLNGEINAAARYSCLRDASAETYDGCYSRLCAVSVGTFLVLCVFCSVEQPRTNLEQSYHSFALESPLFSKACSLASTSLSSEKRRFEAVAPRWNGDGFGVRLEVLELRAEGSTKRVHRGAYLRLRKGE